MTRAIPMLLTSLIALSGCLEPDDETTPTKEEVRALVEAGDAEGDLCDEHGFYGDGECDPWCPEPDEDCSGEDPAVCGGFAGFLCPEGLICVDDPSDDCDPEHGGADCMGICVEEEEPEPAVCGGFAGFLCPEGLVCVDDPDDDCDPEHGGADCMGICVEAEGRTACGGFAGFPCPEGQTCVDDPRDDCSPAEGGADCMGLCL